MWPVTLIRVEALSKNTSDTSPRRPLAADRPLCVRRGKLEGIHERSHTRTSREGGAMVWTPCSGLEEREALPWLPRLIQKARRYEAGRAAGTDVMSGYLYGDNDFIDKQLLAFLGTDDASVCALVREHDDDAVVAGQLVARSGRSELERRAFGIRLRRRMWDFALMEADEGRLPDGPRARLLRFAYNRLLMPIVYAQFSAAERKRRL
jgi:hypothetical protein